MRTFFLLPVIIFLFLACNNQNSTNSDIVDMEESQTQIQQKDADVKMIFYNVPSPVEMAQIIQDAGAVYNAELLNPYKNADNYITTEDLALNLGVYGADLSYNRIFDQMQESINYLSAIRKISDQLKIPQDEGSFTINRFEENLGDRDSLLRIISETYADADIYLKENQRESTASLIIMGGWIEALYIATHLVDIENPDRAIMERIAEQKYSMEYINKLILSYKDDIAIVDTLSANLRLLEKAFNKITISHTSGKVETDNETKSTKIGGETTININIDNVLEIKSIISEIRNYIIGNS